MKIIGLIPARYASTRFPGKPLVVIDGKPMIQWVYENACKSSSLSDVVVVTDDDRIMQAVLAFKGKAIMTQSSHQSGTDRCAEAALQYPRAAAFINIQGDEPKIHPGQIDQVAQLLKQGADLATLARRESRSDLLTDPNIVKVVCNTDGNALYFSRSPIPANAENFLMHVGIYGFRSNILQQITHLPVSMLEQSERLEQLRWLENGYKIQVGLTEHHSISIDTEEDLKKL
jgi:3-deoxy-manno-octulosonate cytidylyltransferase (CMP-KDO synthetase)